MRLRRLGCIAILIALSTPGRAEPAAKRDRHMVTFDLTLVGGSVGYARKIGEHRYIGIDGGIDAAFFSYMIYAGRHLAESDGWSYEEKDGYENKDLMEVFNVNLYVRHVYGDRWNIDTGVRGSLFLHFDSSDDDPGGGFFLGGYASVFYGWKYVKFGPRVQAGVFNEFDPEFGVFISPVIVRIAIPW